MGNNYENLIGKTFNSLKILDVVDPPNYIKDKRKYLKCKCLKCGNIKYINYKNVISGKTKTCGCGHIGMKKDKLYNKYVDCGNYIIGYTSNNVEFYIDKDDYEKVKQYTWYNHTDNYIRTCLSTNMRKNKYCFLHNFILCDIPKGYVVDHINGKPNDNRKENLRIVKQIDNSKNLKLYSNNKSGIKGVCLNNNKTKWCAYITYENKRIYLGSYINKDEAIRVRKEAEEKYFGEYNRKEEHLNNGKI